MTSPSSQGPNAQTRLAQPVTPQTKAANSQSIQQPSPHDSAVQSPGSATSQAANASDAQKVSFSTSTPAPPSARSAQPQAEMQNVSAKPSAPVGSQDKPLVSSGIVPVVNTATGSTVPASSLSSTTDSAHHSSHEHHHHDPSAHHHAGQKPEPHRHSSTHSHSAVHESKEKWYVVLCLNKASGADRSRRKTFRRSGVFQGIHASHYRGCCAFKFLH